jgi:hypothetical protein
VTESNTSNPQNLKEVKLPRRDWILLPALSLLTICVVAASTDLMNRRMFSTLHGAAEDCLLFNDPSTGAQGIPNSVCREKIPEGEVTEYRFNSCGYRTALECGPRRPGAYRIVMIGGSYAMGARVPREKTFAALLPADLSLRTGRNVELYNEGMPWRPPHSLALHFDEVLAAKPDMILWILVPSDVWNPLWQLLPGPEPAEHLSGYRKVKRILGSALVEFNAELYTRRSILFRHFLYESQSQTIASYLAERPDAPYGRRIHGPEFMKADPSAEWQSHLKDLERDVAEIEDQAMAAGVPLVATLLPERAQAALISSGELPEGFDPYKLDNELRSMIVSRGGAYVDILPAFRNTPNSEHGFFPLEGHPNAQGHAMISGLLAEELTKGVVAAIGVAAPQNAVLEQGK